MQLGITLPHYDYSFDSSQPITFEQTATSAQVAIEAGFDALYVSDHVSLDLAKYGGPATPFHSLDPLTTLAALAPITQDVKLGTLVLCEALRHPVMTAAIAHSLADVSQGRFTLGMGAGWYEPDYELYGDEMPPIGERMSRLTESMRMMKSLLEGDTIDTDGKYYSSHATTFSSPVSPASTPKYKVPTLLGGKGDRLLRIVARYCDGWNACWAWEFDAYQERVESLHRACEKYERDPSTVFQSLGLYAVVAETEHELNELFDEITKLSPKGVPDGKTLESWKQGRLVGTTEEVAHQLTQWAELGVDEMIVNPGFAPFHVGSNEIIETIGNSLNNAKKMANL